MKIICISGKAHSGKDTAAVMIKRTLENNGCSVLVTHFADLLKYVCRAYFDWDGKKDDVGRSLLQYVGTNRVRAVDPDFWVSFVAKLLKIFHDEWDYVIIPDCRFPNEYEYLRDSGFGGDVHLVRIERPEDDGGLTAVQVRHPSETAMDSYPCAVIQNTGTPEELERKIRVWLQRIERGETSETRWRIPTKPIRVIR